MNNAFPKPPAKNNETSTSQWPRGPETTSVCYPFNLTDNDTIELEMQDDGPKTYLIIPSNGDRSSALYTANFQGPKPQLSLFRHPCQAVSTETSQQVGTASHIGTVLRSYIDYDCHGHTYRPKPKKGKEQKWHEPYSIVPDIGGKRKTKWELACDTSEFWLLSLVHVKDSKVKIMEIKMKKPPGARTISIPKERVKCQEALDLLVLTALATTIRYVVWIQRIANRGITSGSQVTNTSIIGAGYMASMASSGGCGTSGGCDGGGAVC